MFVAISLSLVTLLLVVPYVLLLDFAITKRKPELLYVVFLMGIACIPILGPIMSLLDASYQTMRWFTRK